MGGSYFSHHLASGLLGGADKSGDGRVTLFEAYAYAYERTVADTAESAAGAQHPTFSYDLAGNGDLVLTDVAARREGVYLPREAPGGVYYLVDRQGFVAAEIVKSEGADRRIALAPGRYRVKRRLADRLRVGEVDVPRGADDHARRGQPARRAVLRRSGEGRDARRRRRAGRSAWAAASRSVFDAPTRASLFPPPASSASSFALRDFFRRDWVLGFDLAAGSANGVVASVGAAPFHFSELSSPRRWSSSGRTAPDAVRGRAPRAAADDPEASRTTPSRRSTSRRCRRASSAASPGTCRARPASSRAAACTTFSTTSTETAPSATGSWQPWWRMTSKASPPLRAGGGCWRSPPAATTRTRISSS